MEISSFIQRRRELIEKLGNGIAIIPTAPERMRNSDVQYPYRFDSYFWYLSGFAEPEAVLVLIGGECPQSLLFCREKNPSRETWEGMRYGPDVACVAFGFDMAHPISELTPRLPELIANRETLWHSFGHSSPWDAKIVAALNTVRSNRRSGKRPPKQIRDLHSLIDDMRLRKDVSEIDAMRRAAVISSNALRRAMQVCRPGKMEYTLEAELLYEFRRHGGTPAYLPIVASGINACTLHYIGNDRLMQDGDLVLVDAGCEIEGYASDITRTFPVSGKFTQAQRDVYGIVLSAQEAAVAALAPGMPVADFHEAALRVLVQGMIDLKLLEGSLDGIIESKAYRRFYMHRTGHWLGLDVHDVGAYTREEEGEGEEESQKLEAGMVLTVEPGLYIPCADDVPEELAGIGIRTEDNVLIMADGCKIYTSAPKTVEEIEDTMKKAEHERRKYARNNT
ncbi:MAG: aminopeptidase P N-terminal domain-containing protein [Betaproteobacteria bacterium]|nr:aminopeptidase P N-terminal domain-containing protein [Betaproteobacteria bacterium]